jgi:hypothetical protein
MRIRILGMEQERQFEMHEINLNKKRILTYRSSPLSPEILIHRATYLISLKKI